jgi:hypothetical protein
MINVSNEVIINRLEEIINVIKCKSYDRAILKLLDLESLITCTSKEHEHKN